jgi:hypothetical protein
LSLPAPDLVTVADLTGTGAEAWEGVLVTVENVVVTNNDAGYGEWEVDSSLRIDDMLYRPHLIANGASVDSITGILHYSYGAYKLEPRDGDDIVNLQTCPSADQCVDSLSAGDLVVTEMLFDTQESENYCEWVEIYNNTSGTVDLFGLTLEEDGGRQETVDTATVVAAGDYAVVAKGDAANWVTNCPGADAGFTPDGFYGGSVDLANGGDYVYLKYVDAAETETVLDETPTYDGDWTTANLSSSCLDDSCNDTASNWCQPTSEFGSAGDKGTPGVSNDACR